MTATTHLETKTSIVDQEIFSNLEARKILQFMLRTPTTPVAAEITPTDEIRYPQLDPVLSLPPETTVDLLSRMVEAKALVADMVDKAPACPECGSHQLSTRYLCPKCFSYDISRSFLYEHLKCGKVASDDAFKKGDRLICPKCQIVLHNFGIEYRAVGAWYKCGNCNESFSAPSNSHFCRPKRHQFTMDRTRLAPIYQYRLNPTARAEIRREIFMYSDVITTLEGLGVTVYAPHDLPGRSGQPQTFDIVTMAKGGRWGGSKTIAIDVISSDAGVPVEAVRTFSTKVKDARASESYLIAVPGLTDDAKTLAKNLKLSIVEAPSLKEATAALLSRGAFKDLGT